MIQPINDFLLLGIILIVSLVAIGHLFRPYFWSRQVPRQSKHNGRTLRIRGIPLDWDIKRLSSFLVESFDSALAVKSLARETQGDVQSATVFFEGALDIPCMPGAELSIPLPISPNEELPRTESVQLDTHFHGMTTLFIPPEEHHQVDIVALSGLGGHAFGSFKQRAGNHMWLRDALPYHLTRDTTGQSMARIITFGYESAIAGSKKVQNLEDLGIMLHDDLLPLIASPIVRPIIFIAHSLGGLIVKQTLIALSKSKHEEDQRLLQAVYGIVFFGVPHDGMDIKSLIPMAGDGPNRFLIESLSPFSSQILSVQTREFESALGGQGDSEVVCFYETVESPTARKVYSSGTIRFLCELIGLVDTERWAMNGPPALLVTKASATHGRSWENGTEHICAVARTHSNMVKFGPHDHEYDKVRQRLRGLAHRALSGGRRIQGSNSKFIVPYPENHDFVGRSMVMEALKHELGFNQPIGTSQARVSIYGLGGVGKTQLALAYVYLLHKTRKEVSVFWVHASTAARFRQSLTVIAQECQIPGYEDPKSDVPLLVKEWLGKKSRGQWLMVIDNADDMGLFFKRSHELSHTISDESNLQRYLPECPHGTLLLTTRDKQVAVNFGKGSLPIELKHMDNGECEDLLRTRLGDMSSIGEELATLAANLEFLPLALVQAAAFIQQNCITVEQYIELQGKSDQHLVELLSEEFETVGRDTETPRAVAQTWVLSFQQIKKQNPLAARLLSLMSLLDRQGIPKELLSNYIKGSDLDLVKAFGLLKAFSLVVEGKGGTFDMHRLVYLVTRKWLSNEGTISSFHKEALAMLSQEFPRGAAFENRTKCAAYLPHAKAVVHPESIALEGEVDIPPTLSNNLGGYFVIQGMWHDAEVFCRQAVEASKIQLGADHGDTLAIMNDLALVFMGRGRWEEAEQLGMQALEASKMHLGADHPHTLTSMNILASVFRKQGRWEEAEQLVMQALEASKTQLGEDHPDTLLSMSSLALIFEQQGRWEEAEKLQVQAVEASKTRLGAHHSDTLISMNILASVFEKQGRLEEAEKLELQVWEAFKVQLGPDHPSTLTNMTNLALIYKKQGRWEEAAQLGTQALEGFKIQLGADHPNTLSAMHNLAFTWYRIGKISEAIDLLQTCVDLRKVKLGLDHPSTQSSISALERWERKRKRERKSNT